MNIYELFRRQKKRPQLPTDVGEFVVFHYDENDEQVEATRIIFGTRGGAIRYMEDHVDPATDPFVAEKKEKIDGNQKSKNPLPGTIRRPH